MENAYNYGYDQGAAKPRRKKKTIVLPIIGILLGLVMLAMGVLGFAGTTDSFSNDALMMDDTQFAEIKTDTDYYVKVLAVDYIATHTVNDEEKEDYYLGVFQDADDEPFYCVIRAEKDTELYRELDNYATDETMMIGDLFVNGYFGLSNLSSVEGLKDSYQKAVDAYDETLSGEFGHVTPSSYILDFLAADEAAYKATAAKENKEIRIAACVVGALGLLLILLAILHIRKIGKYNKQLAQPYDAPAVPQEPTYTPYAQPQEQPQPTYTPYVQPEAPAAEPAAPQEPQEAAPLQDGTEPF